MMKKVFALVVVSALCLAMFAACDTATAPAPAGPAAVAGDVDLTDFVIDPSLIPQAKLDTTLYLAVSIRGVDNPYLATIYEGMMMFSEYLDGIGQKHETQLLDSGGSNDREVNNMRQFAARAGGNAIAYSDPNENAIAEALAEAMAESGGFIGTAWNKPADVGPMDYTPNWVIHTSPDNVKSGYEISVALFEFMGDSGKVFVVEGMLGNTAASDRYKGFEMALAEYPGIEVVGHDTGNWATAEALNLVETWLNMHPDVGGIWCANDNMATGALQALDRAGLRGTVGVVGIDANTDIVEAVRDGYAVATVSSNGWLQGGYTLAICYAAWTGLIDVASLSPDYREFATPALLITIDNAADYLANPPVFDFSRPFDAKDR
ncbi:MAG: sugar ABC transporter substrate-binding protein [Defluviitaleaceae bacterium]|nr:sugar ABC transporter substrate-binding protein [Defluviitaleaceae bacterium]MCL2837088.1 sugar ABC transporter substrate-binding protein [Defluviitaleaceae bacterium]